MSARRDTLCALPFGHLFLSEEGKSYPCCYALESGAPNRDEAGNPVTVRTPGDIARAWNCEGQKALRRQMLAGERPSACARCFALEDHGLQSLREVSNRRFGDELDRALGRMAEDGGMPFELYSLDLRLGNACNLRCQMCSPVSSRLLAQDFARLYPGADFSAYERLDWHRDPALVSALLDASSGLREAHFAGGEPFLIPEVARFVELLSERPHARRVRLSFNTNATVLPERLLGLFPRFEGVRLVVSLDGLGEVNDYIRFPSRFEKIEANLRSLHARRAEWNLTHVCVNVTVQVHNLLTLPELIRWLTREFPGFLPFPVLGPLHVPECLSIQVLPAAVKDEATRRLRALVEEERAHWSEIGPRDPAEGAAERFAGSVEGLISFMNAADRSDLLPALRHFSDVMSGIRGQKLSVPGL